MITNIRRVEIERFSVTTSERFDEVLRRVESSIAHPDAIAVQTDLRRARSFSEVEHIVRIANGPYPLMEFIRFDLGDVLRTRPETRDRKAVRLVIGNPVILQEMATHVPDTVSYIPISIMIDERSDGVHLSYDRLSSLLAPYGNDEATSVARTVDLAIENLLSHAATPLKKAV